MSASLPLFDFGDVLRDIINIELEVIYNIEI